MSYNSQRYDFIDLLKGFGIFLVVWGHTMVPRSALIYSFHMPLFFFISGFLYKNKPLKEFLKGKMIRLYLPYAAFTLLSWLFYFIMLELQNRKDLIGDHLPKILSLFTGTGRNGGNDSIWFLSCLLVVSILFWCINNLFKEPGRIFLASLTISSIGYYLGTRRIFLPFKIDVALTAMFFYFGGYYFRQQNLLTRVKKMNRSMVILLSICCLALFFYLAKLNIDLTGIPKVSMISNHLGNFFLFYLTAIFAIVFLFIASNRIESIYCFNYLGHHSLAVLAVHKPILSLLKYSLEPYVETDSMLYEIIVSVMVIILILRLIHLWNNHQPHQIAKKPTY